VQRWKNDQKKKKKKGSSAKGRSKVMGIVHDVLS
jgi:hypothetical protein